MKPAEPSFADRQHEVDRLGGWDWDGMYRRRPAGDYSELVDAMRTRLADLGLTDDGRLRALMDAEDVIRGPEEAVYEWLEEHGWPVTDDGWETDDYQAMREEKT